MKKLTKYTPERLFTIENDGFHGTYYKPAVNKYPGKAVVLFGGSAGSYMLTEMCAERYYEAGMTVMAAAYRDVPGAPSELRNIPLELIENAVKWCRENAADKVAVSGISLGGQLALLLGAYLPEQVSAVVAVNPMNFSQQGMSSFKKLHFTNDPCFTFRGKPLPYYPIGMTDMEFKKLVKQDARAHHEFMCLSEFYKKAVTSMPEDADYIIPAENTKGPILLLSAGMDVMLPSEDICKRVMERLDKKGFKYPHKHIHYDIASHYLCPAKPLTAKLFSAERKYPRECDASREKAFEDTMNFLGKEW